MQAPELETTSCDERPLLAARPSARRGAWALAAFGALAGTALAASCLRSGPGRQRSESLRFMEADEMQDAETYRKKIEGIIHTFAHICPECRGDAQKYYGSKLKEVSSLEKKCEDDKSACKSAEKDIKALRKEVDGAWTGTKCPEDMPVSCKMSSSCKKFPKRACAPKTCHPFNLLKSMAKNNDCEDASIKCEGGDEISLKDKKAEAYKEMIETRIGAFAHICADCRTDAKKYYGEKLDAVSELEKKCDADESACEGAQKDMDALVKEVDGAWAGTKCPAEMPMTCKMTSSCRHFPKRACAPKTCHPFNLLKSMAKNNNCTDASIQCEGQAKISLKDKKAEAYKEMIEKRIAAFAHICKECRGDAKKYYGSKLDEVSKLEKKCDEDEAACKDVQGDMEALVKEVDGAWDGTRCPKEMPMSCKISSDCKHFPKKACAPKTCRPINLLKSMGKNNKCEEASIECDGEDKVSLSGA